MSRLWKDSPGLKGVKQLLVTISTLSVGTSTSSERSRAWGNILYLCISPPGIKDMAYLLGVEVKLLKGKKTVTPVM